MIERDLFGDELPAPRIPYKGHAARPGTGPEGETCRTCKHRTHNQSGARPYQKCALMRHCWTLGPGTDIRAKDPACRFWTAIEAEGGNDDK